MSDIMDRLLDTTDRDAVSDAREEIAALRADNERLREFVLFVDKWTNYKPNKPEKPTSYEDCVKTIAPMAREFARAALEEKP